MNAFDRLHAIRQANVQAGYDMEEQRGRFDALRVRHETGTAPRAVSAYQLFQTPPELAQRMVAKLDLRPGDRVLEPSAGLGRLLHALPPGCLTMAVEMAPACAGELYRQARSGVILKQRDFLALTPAEAGQFDAVVMNPPFHLRSDIRHILHALAFLRPPGRLVALCMDTHHRETALRPLAASWERIPAGTFKKEGTGVGVVLLTIEAN